MKIEKGIQNRPLRIVVYGQEGIGKSTECSYIPGALFLDTENGSSRLAVDRVHVRSLGDLRSVCSELLAGGHNYKAVVMDTADNVYRFCGEEVCKKGKVDSMESFGYGKGYVQNAELFDKVRDTLDKFVDAGMHAVVVCHSRIVTVNPPDGEEYSRYTIKLSTQANKQSEQARERLKEWADVILFCKAGVCVRNGKAIGGVERVICTQTSAAYEAKNRHDLPAEVPMGGHVWKMLLNPAQAAHAVGHTETPQEVATESAEAPEDPATIEILFSAAEIELLQEYFRSLKKLQDGQSLNDLPARFLAALKSRPAAAVAEAKKWKGGEA